MVEYQGTVYGGRYPPSEAKTFSSLPVFFNFPFVSDEKNPGEGLELGAWAVADVVRIRAGNHP